MKKVFYLFVTLIAAAACVDEKPVEKTGYEVFNICLVLDGTDVVSNQYSVPKVSVDEILELSKVITKEGQGTLYVTYIDDQAENNTPAIFEHYVEDPMTAPVKQPYVEVAAYEKEVQAYERWCKDNDAEIALELEDFRNQCMKIVSTAYSERISGPYKNSDVNGAVAQAVKLLEGSATPQSKSFILMVSDGVDNIGKEQPSLPVGVELLLVNGSTSDHSLAYVTRELATLPQAESIIFKNL